MDMKNDFFIEKMCLVCVCCEDKPASKAPDTRGLCTASVYHFFVIPDKECVSASPDNPCELFRSMAFPIAEFSPAPMPLPVSDRNKCGCNG